MAGSSLWLIPPEDHAIYTILSDLISSKLPSNLAQFQTVPFPAFAPHLTLTSDILHIPDDPQSWLDALNLPSAADVKVRLKGLDHGERWTKKLFLRAEKELVKSIGAACRSVVEGNESNASERVEMWVDNEWDPHVSLVYSSLSVTEEIISTCSKALEDAGIDLSDAQSSSWSGGSVWLVPTYLPVQNWKPIATRSLV